jgi:hypothetical protein
VAIVGAHVLLYTTEPERLRAVFRDVSDGDTSRIQAASRDG